jgi:hypothetical protein
VAGRNRFSPRLVCSLDEENARLVLDPQDIHCRCTGGMVVGCGIRLSVDSSYSSSTLGPQAISIFCTDACESFLCQPPDFASRHPLGECWHSRDRKPTYTEFRKECGPESCSSLITRCR